METLQPLGCCLTLNNCCYDANTDDADAADAADAVAVDAAAAAVVIADAAPVAENF